MRAVWYEENGDASVLQVGEMPDPEPGPGEVRVRVVTSGVNPSDWKRRQGTTARISHPRIIPNQDGGGIIDMVGDGVSESRIGERVWLLPVAVRESVWHRGRVHRTTVEPGHSVAR